MVFSGISTFYGKAEEAFKLLGIAPELIFVGGVEYWEGMTFVYFCCEKIEK